MSNGQAQLRIVPVYWREAKQFILDVHRHHEPGGNGRFSVGVQDDEGKLRGVAVMGRTKARLLPHKEVLEVTRVATDGCDNACSALYGAACRVHKPHGYAKVVTYTLVSEPGTSLRAAGWRPVALTDGGSWSRRSRARTDKHPTEPKVRWECRCSELPSLRCPFCDHEWHHGVFCAGRAECDGPDCFESHPCACSHPDPANYAEVPANA